MKYIDFINQTKLDICFIFMGKGKKLNEMKKNLSNSQKGFIHESVNQKNLNTW